MDYEVDIQAIKDKQQDKVAKQQQKELERLMEIERKRVKVSLTTA